MDHIEDDDELIVRTIVNGQHVFLRLCRVGGQAVDVNDEGEIAARPVDLKEALTAVSGVASAITDSLKATGAAKTTVEFGCEFALDTGLLTTIIGKASARSALKITLEWNQGS